MTDIPYKKRDVRTPLYDAPNFVTKYAENQYVALYRAIIVRALMDAVLKPRSENVKNETTMMINKAHNRAIIEAKEYLESDGLIYDCENANLSADRVIRAYQLRQGKRDEKNEK